MSETALAWWLADTTRDCFSPEDALDVYAVLGAGETYAAVNQILQIAVQKKHALPRNLLVALGRWLDSYAGEPQEQTIRRYLWRLDMCPIDVPDESVVAEPGRGSRRPAMVARPAVRELVDRAAPTRCCAGAMPPPRWDGSSTCTTVCLPFNAS